MPKNDKVEKSNPNQTNSQSITDKLKQLDQEIDWFYSEDFQLDQALAKYKTATNLAKEIKQDLAELKNQVEVIEDFTKN